MKIYVVYLDSRDEYVQFFGTYSKKEKANKRIEELKEQYSGVDWIEFDIDKDCYY